MIEFSEVLGALSVAADLGIGAPPETGIGAALLAGRLGRRIGLSEDQCAELFYASLLRFIGCSIGIHEAQGASLGDPEGYQRGLAMSDLGDFDDVLARLDENMATAASPRDRRAAFDAIGQSASDSENIKSLTQPHCELGERLATDMNMPGIVADALNQVYERWDGGGAPVGAAGEEICLPARVMHITATFELLRRSLGLDAAFALILRRRGGHFDPALCDAIDADRDELVEGLESVALLDVFLDEAPGNWRIGTEKLVDVARAWGQNVDHRSAYTLAHSAGVAELGAGAGAAGGLSEDQCEELLIAGYLHDLGQVGVPAAICDKPGELTRSERARVEQHTFLTDSILRAAPALEPYAKLASSHHERADGSGYHRQIEDPDLQCAILASAECYQAMLEDRPHREALGPDKAADELLAMSDRGELNPMAVRAVLEAAVGRRTGRRSLPANLTKREAQVLCLIAQGMSNKRIATKLSISAKTVEHHVGHIYDKIGIRSRPGAAMFAARHNLSAR